MEKQEAVKKNRQSKYIIFTLALLLSMSIGTVSVSAETTDMTETNGILREVKSGIESKIDALQTYLATILSDISLKVDNMNLALTDTEYPLMSKMNELQELQVFQNQIVNDIQTDTDSMLNVQELIMDNLIVMYGEQNAQTDYIEEIKKASVSANEAVQKIVSANEADINNAEMMKGLNETLEELNTNLDMINTFIGYMYAFCIFLLVVIISVVVYRILNKTLINNAFRGF